LNLRALIGVTIVSPLSKDQAMSSTTSLKLPDELKSKIADTAKRRGKTAHALMVEALQQAMDEAQLEDEFYQDAIEASENMMRTNMAYSFDEIKRVARARVRGDFSVVPTAHAVDPSKPMRPDLFIDHHDRDVQ
jgi:predicted transcriptional regulator